MLPVISTDVRFCLAPETDLDYQPNFLEYFSNLYELIARFSISQKAQAKDLWCELTDDSSTVCLLVQEENAYSVWGLTNQKIDFPQNTVDVASSVSSNPVDDTARWLGYSLWLVITDLAGIDRAQAFGIDVIDSSLPIQSWVELQTASLSEIVWPQSIAPEKIADISAVFDEFQRLAAKYLGHNCARQVIQDLTAQLHI